MAITVRPRLTELRKSRDITQAQLADMSGVPQGSISRFDRNERVDITHMFRIARALGVSVEDLFEVRED